MMLYTVIQKTATLIRDCHGLLVLLRVIQVNGLIALTLPGKQINAPLHNSILY